MAYVRCKNSLGASGKERHVNGFTSFKEQPGLFSCFVVLSSWIFLKKKQRRWKRELRARCVSVGPWGGQARVVNAFPAHPREQRQRSVWDRGTQLRKPRARAPGRVRQARAQRTKGGQGPMTSGAGGPGNRLDLSPPSSSSFPPLKTIRTKRQGARPSRQAEQRDPARLSRARRRGAEGLRGGLVHTLTGGGGAPAGAAAARASGTGRSGPGGACPSGRASGPTPPALGPRAGPRLPGSGRRRGRLGPGDEEAVSGRQRRGAEVAVGSAPGPPVPRVAGRQARAAQGHLQALPAASASRPRLPKTLAPPGRSDRRPPSMRSPSARGAGR